MLRSRSQQMSADPSSRRPTEVETTLHLLERARTGDQEALDRLFARHAEPLRRWATGRLPKWARDVADTDDLVQDTLLRTFKRIGDFEPRGVGALQAYLRQAILNGIREELRRKGRQPDATGLDGLEADSHLSPLEQAIGGEALDRYERALARLTEAERETIIGRIEMGYTYDELAEALGKPSGEAARKAAQRALVRLVEEMERDSGQAGWKARADSPAQGEE
jgi:RNA polymerase sigma factor (sigma-70 family)